MAFVDAIHAEYFTEQEILMDFCLLDTSLLDESEYNEYKTRMANQRQRVMGLRRMLTKLGRSDLCK